MVPYFGVPIFVPLIIVMWQKTYGSDLYNLAQLGSMVATIVVLRTITIVEIVVVISATKALAIIINHRLSLGMFINMFSGVVA